MKANHISKAGLGIRPELFAEIERIKPELGFLEAHSENYFGESIARDKLLALRQDYPLFLHGVGLSLGRADGLHKAHLEKLANLVNLFEPIVISEHLAWSAYSHQHLPDLLPLPLTEEALLIVCEHVDQMQDVLKQQILIENPSNYLLFEQAQIPETEFLNAITERTGCGVLLDINNVYVSATNLAKEASNYIEQLNSSSVGQYHLAGHTPITHAGERVLIDTHNQTVADEVWCLYEQALECHGVRPTLFEWDSDFPEIGILLAECEKANKRINGWRATETNSKPVSRDSKPFELNCQRSGSAWLAAFQARFFSKVINLEPIFEEVSPLYRERLWIYQNNSFAAVQDYMAEVYPAVQGVVGADYFRQMVQLHLQKTPPSSGNINDYGERFIAVLDELPELNQLPYLSDLIQLQWLEHLAYFSEDIEPIAPSEYQQEDLLGLPLLIHPELAVFRSNYPILDIREQSLPEYAGEVGVELTVESSIIAVTKRHQKVVVEPIISETQQLIEAIKKSENLLQAIARIDGSISPEAMSTSLSKLFELGVLVKK